MGRCVAGMVIVSNFNPKIFGARIDACSMYYDSCSQKGLRMRDRTMFIITLRKMDMSFRAISRQVPNQLSRMFAHDTLALEQWNAYLI